MSHQRNIHDPIEMLEDDLLDRQAFAEQILMRLKSEDCPPAVGIYGSWGTGKTSLLKLLNLKGKQACEEIHIEEFDAWQYEGVGNLFIPIIVRLIKLAGEDAESNKWGEAAKRLVYVTTLAATSAIANQIIGIGIPEIQGYFDRKESITPDARWKNLTDEIKETSAAFEKLIENVLQNKKTKKLVLCIDNLDRCSPENVVHLLESVKNFVGGDNCVWVFAMDSGVIASYIFHKYEGTNVDSYSYLDKIIPEQYHLSINNEQLASFVNDIFTPEFRELAYFDWTSYAHIPRVLAPRRIIKTVMKFEHYIKNPNSRHLKADLVFKLILLYHSWPDFYEQFSCNSSESIGRILLNFTDESIKAMWKSRFQLATPLTDRYKNDSELTYFLQQAFLASGRSTDDTSFVPEDMLRDIYWAILDLRQIGLP